VAAAIANDVMAGMALLQVRGKRGWDVRMAAASLRSHPESHPISLDDGDLDITH
jgi:hypothetical protein